MSKNRNYQNYYKRPEIERPVENAVIKVTTEESPKEEVVVETAPTEDAAFETEVTPKEVIQKSSAIVKGAEIVKNSKYKRMLNND